MMQFLFVFGHKLLLDVQFLALFFWGLSHMNINKERIERGQCPKYNENWLFFFVCGIWMPMLVLLIKMPNQLTSLFFLIINMQSSFIFHVVRVTRVSFIVWTKQHWFLDLSLIKWNFNLMKLSVISCQWHLCTAVS